MRTPIPTHIMHIYIYIIQTSWCTLHVYKYIYIYIYIYISYKLHVCFRIKHHTNPLGHGHGYECHGTFTASVSARVSADMACADVTLGSRVCVDLCHAHVIVFVLTVANVFHVLIVSFMCSIMCLP